MLGVNAVLRSLKFNKGDALLISTYTYEAVQNACRYVADKHGKNDLLMLSYCSFTVCAVAVIVVVVLCIFCDVNAVYCK